MCKINNFLPNEFLMSSKLFSKDGGFLNSNHLVFADYLKIYLTIKNNDDHLALQTGLNKLLERSNMNGDSLNISKSFFFSISRNISDYWYYVNIDVLNRTVECKDLGTIFDQHQTYIQHYNKIIGQATVRAYSSSWHRIFSKYTENSVLKLRALLYKLCLKSKVSVLHYPYWCKENSWKHMHSKFV